MTGAARLEFRLLGRFAVLRDGAEIPPADFGGRKVRTLLRILATRRGSFVSNDVLTELLWGDRPPADPAANLQVLVNRARKALGERTVIRTGPGGYALDGGTGCVVDAEAFAATVADDTLPMAQLRAALDRWGGEPLAEDAYEAWATDYRTRLGRLHQDALERAAGLSLDAADFSAAVDYASAAAEAEPLRESAVLALVRALAASGDGAAALARYDDYRRALASELGVDPSPAAAALHRHLLGTTGRARPPRAARTRSSLGELPFVGRRDELDTLRTALNTPPGEHAATVLVAGASGAGKSRLLGELASAEPTIRARCYLAERAEPWSLVRTLLREVLAADIGYRDRLPPALATALAALLPELDEAGEVSADPESRRALVQEAALRLLGAAEEVVVIDDVQWADPTSLAVVEAAAARLRGWRLVLAYRPEEIADGSELAALLGRLDVTARVELAALPQTAVDELVAGQELSVALAEHTDATPLALGEVLRALAAEGLVTRATDGRWRAGDASATTRAVELAGQGQRHAIRSRVARQPAPARRLLELLSLLGRQTAVATLALADGCADNDVLERLGALYRAGLVRLGELGWSTAHDMVAEAVVEALDPAARAQLHAALARALAADGDPAEIARHHRDAGDTGRAATEFRAAARRALDAFADREAVHLADEGLVLRPPQAVAAALQEIRAQARGRLGDLPGARADLRQALAARASGPERARVLARMAVLTSGADDLVHAAELAEAAILEAGSDSAARAQALEVAAVLDMNLDRPERAGERSAAALELYRCLGDARGAARILDARAMATFLDGDIGAGGEALRQAADLFADSGDLVHVVTPRSTSGHALVFAGRAAEGLAATDAALELARTLGHPEGQAYALWHRTEALAALGRAAEADAAAAEALAIATKLGHRGWIATSWRATGIAAELAGDLDTALRAYLNSLDASEHLGLFASWAAARAALVHVARGTPEPARPLVARALSEGPPLGHYEARLAQVELAAATGDADVGRLARAAIERAVAGGMVQGCDRLAELAAAGP